MFLGSSTSTNCSLQVTVYVCCITRKQHSFMFIWLEFEPNKLDWLEGAVQSEPLVRGSLRFGAWIIILKGTLNLLVDIWKFLLRCTVTMVFTFKTLDLRHTWIWDVLMYIQWIVWNQMANHRVSNVTMKHTFSWQDKQFVSSFCQIVFMA